MTVENLSYCESHHMTPEPGPKGEKGDKGDPGDRGVQGFQGRTGPRGEAAVSDAGISSVLSDSDSISAGILNATYGTFISPMSKGAIGNGVANDYAALAATLTASSTGTVIDLGGRTFKLGQLLTINKTVTIRNGTLTSAVDRVATITAPNVRMENVQFIRTGPATANTGALTLAAAGCNLIDVTATSTQGEGLRMGNGLANGTTVRGGYYATSDPIDSFAIRLLAGAAHNYDVKISGVKARNTGYGTGIGLYNCSRSTVEKCDVRNIRQTPIVALTGWTLVSGTVYRTLDRTDASSNAIRVDGLVYTRAGQDDAAQIPLRATTPGVGEFGTPTTGNEGAGYIYINTGVDPNTQTVTSRRTNGYGILFYGNSSTATGVGQPMNDNLMAHNYVEDTDGFGLYYQCSFNDPQNNRTLQNTLRNVCLMGRATEGDPFAGIAVFGGRDIVLDGDIIDGCGTAGSISGLSTVAPGIDLKAAPGGGTGDSTQPVRPMSGSINNVTVVNGTEIGISLGVGYWNVTNTKASNNAGDGITSQRVTDNDTVVANLTNCVAENNGGTGVRFEHSTNAQVRVAVMAGQFSGNTAYNMSLVKCRDVRVVGPRMFSGGIRSLNVSANCVRVLLDGISLGPGSGISIASGVTDLTVNNLVHDNSSGTKLNVNGQPYKVGGNTGYATEWRCTGTPEGQITAAIGSRAMRLDGGTGTTLYIKESGTGNTGWVAK